MLMHAPAFTCAGNPQFDVWRGNLFCNGKHELRDFDPAQQATNTTVATTHLSTDTAATMPSTTQASTGGTATEMTSTATEANVASESLTACRDYDQHGAYQHDYFSADEH